ncbi:MAG: signal recognition particle receptor subunit alpha [Caldisericia bacterium]|jgi:signal recognition particle subunit SRP54|nr:signal recognition particle receptor subunit alpha [Caldisericia bacterium]
MFENIRKGIRDILDKFGRKGLLTRSDIEEGLNEFKKILISADVNLKVVKEILKRVEEEALKEEILKSVLPEEQITKILYDTLLKIIGKSAPLKFSSIPPTEIILFGIQGSGKTTTAGKLSYYLKNKGYRSLLVPLDLKRPGAIKQLEEIANIAQVSFYFEENLNILKLIKKSKEIAKKERFDFIIYDTPGRIHIDQEMMRELKEIKDEIKPTESLLVASSLLGQGSVDIALEFKRYVGLTGIIATMLDGDSKGGAILSMRYVTSVPIKFIGVGEKIDDFEEFDEESLVLRILGRTDIKGLIKKIEKLKEEKIEVTKKEKFNLETFLIQIESIEKMGGFASFLGYFPQISDSINFDEKNIKKMKAIIQSMTKKERLHPEIIDGDRKKRIAKGSGTSINDVNILLKNYKMMKNLLENKNIDKILKRGGIF